MNAGKVMIVDDDKEFLEELREMLVNTSYDVTAINESVLAVKVARAVRPDIILLDLRMRAMSGFEVADELKRYPETKDIPIIALTGFYTFKEHSWLINFCGIKKCIRKPFNPLDIIAEIEFVLKKNSSDGRIDANDTKGGKRNGKI